MTSDNCALNTEMKRSYLFFVALALALPNLSTVRAATNVVTNNNDSGPGSLRQVILASASGDTIVFSNVVTGTIRLTSGELVVGKNLAILGPGPAVLAVDGNAPNTTNRVFHIQSGAISTIAGLTITNGLAAGTLPANRGGGIYN